MTMKTKHPLPIVTGRITRKSGQLWIPHMTQDGDDIPPGKAKVVILTIMGGIVARGTS